MFPLSAGGHVCTGLREGNRIGIQRIGAFQYPRLAFAQVVAVAVAMAMIAIATGSAAAGQVAYGDDFATSSGHIPDSDRVAGAASVVSFFAPVVEPAINPGVAPIGVPMPAAGRIQSDGRHWTLREPLVIRASSSGEPASGGYMSAPVPAHAEVSMFSWKEIVAVALVIAFALGALLAFTGGGDHRHSRHS